MQQNKLLYLARNYYRAKKALNIYLLLGIKQITEQIVENLRVVRAVYLTGDLAWSLKAIIGDGIDTQYSAKLVEKAEEFIGPRINAGG